MEKQVDKQTSEIVSIVTEGIEVFRVEMEAIDRISMKIGNKTTRIIRIVVGLLGVLALYLVVLTYNMAQDLGDMIDSLDEMYLEFGAMSSEMKQITHHVQSMGVSVDGMPTVAENMQALNSDVGGLQASMETLNTDMGLINGDVGQISVGTTEMGFRLHNVQRSVGVMSNDVRHMLKPMTTMPW